jgi:hypothetical protein
MKIAFKLSTPEAVEYANGHKETNYGDYGRLDGDKDKWFHIPAFNGLDYLRHLNEWLDGPCSGYTDVTPNFLEDYYRPWKEGRGEEPGKMDTLFNLGANWWKKDRPEVNESHPLYNKFKEALNIRNDMRPGPNPFVIKCIEIAEEYVATNP